MIGSDAIEVFRQESRELLDQLEHALLDLGQAPQDVELVDSAFRALHTLKGSGAMFGFEAVAAFVHDFETAFDKVRKGQAQISPKLIAVSLSAKDHIQRLIHEPATAADGQPILDALHEIVGAVAVGAAPEPSAATASAGGAGWRIRFRLPDYALTTGANPLLLLDELRALGDCEIAAEIDEVPPLEDLDPEVLLIGWDVRLTGEASQDAIEDVFMFMRDDMELEISELEISPTEAAQAATAEDKPVEAASPQGAPERTAAEQGLASLRVPAERLDALIDRVGELVIAQARLSQIASAGEDMALKAVAEDIERLSSALRDTTMGIRMVPIGTLFGRFRRLVHDLSSELGKPVEFVTAGEATELDKTVIERLADPLMHLIRNAIDHGVESRETRAAAGKPAVGVVRLAAVHAGSEVSISISDDGAGLNTERIRAKAVEAGLLAANAAVSDAQLHQFLFHPGFSTAREVTAVSGRGVGMDVVKRIVESLRGSIGIATTPGGGTTTTLRLPLTLAIIESMLVRVGASRYAIPLSAVEECVELPSRADLAGAGRNFLNIRGALTPFLRLRELFNSDAPSELHQKVVIVSAGEMRVGLVVDQIIGTAQTVIKSLSKLHAGVEAFSGATILGDGRVALILDVAQLVALGQTLEEQARSAPAGRVA